MKTFLLGLVVGLLVFPVGGLLYLKVGNLPVATSDPSFPLEKQLVRVPMGARIEREMPKAAPFAADEATLKAGAELYVAQCASCHGLPDKPSAFAATMFPRAPQLFVRHGDHVGVSDDEPGESYWKVANGLRLTGMPAYAKVLSEKEMWQVTLLVANADKVPPAAMQLLVPHTPPTAPAP